MPAIFAIRKSAARQYYFALLSPTSTVVMTSELYRRKSEARRAIASVIAGVNEDAAIEDETGEVPDEETNDPDASGA